MRVSVKIVLSSLCVIILACLLTASSVDARPMDGIVTEHQQHQRVAAYPPHSKLASHPPFPTPDMSKALDFLKKLRNQRNVNGKAGSNSKDPASTMAIQTTRMRVQEWPDWAKNLVMQVAQLLCPEDENGESPCVEGYWGIYVYYAIMYPLMFIFGDEM